MQLRLKEVLQSLRAKVKLPLSRSSATREISQALFFGIRLQIVEKSQKKFHSSQSIRGWALIDR
jgi:hypothetical protein